MLVGDLVYSDDFIMSCNSKAVYNSISSGFKKPLDAILDMKISYITHDGNALVIEAKRSV